MRKRNLEQKWIFGDVQIIYRTFVYENLGIDNHPYCEIDKHKVTINVPFNQCVPFQRIDLWARDFLAHHFIDGEAEIIKLVYNSYTQDQMAAHKRSFYRRKR